MTRPLLWGAGLLAAGLALWMVWTGVATRPPDFSAMAAPDQAALGELLWRVAANPEASDAGMTERARQVFSRYAPPTAGQREALREAGRAMARLHRLFWEDALQAVATGRLVRSPARGRLEQALIAQGYLVPQRVEANDAMMRRIAAREPIPTNHGVEMLMDDAMIARVLESQDERETAAALDRLLFVP